MKYFVLNPTKRDAYGMASRKAIRAYAISIHDVNPTLAIDLHKWVDQLSSNILQGEEVKNERT